MSLYTDKPEGKREGWHFPPNSRKCHYFIEAEGSTSLCGKYGFFTAFQLLQPGSGEPSPDDCASCRNKLARRAEQAVSS